MIKNMCIDPVVLLADPNGKAWPIASEILNYLLQKDLNVRLVEVLVKDFRNKEKKIKIKENVRKSSCFFIHDSNKHPEAWFFELLAVLEALKGSGVKEITAVLPNMAYSRQDRKDESRVAVSAKIIADCISLYANHVITVDLHASQIQSFYKVPLDNLYSLHIAARYLFEKHPDLLGNLVVASTDEGGAKLARAFSERLKRLGVDSEIAIGSKFRPKEGEVSDYKIVGNVYGKDVLIVEDMIDSGNTLVKCAQVLKNQGAKRVYVYATHGIFTQGFGIFSDLDKIFVSNTLNQEGHPVEVVPLTEMLAEAIYRESKGESISKLFD